MVGIEPFVKKYQPEVFEMTWSVEDIKLQKLPKIRRVPTHILVNKDKKKNGIYVDFLTQKFQKD